MKLETGMITTSGNFILDKKIEDIHELIKILYSKKSIFARNRMYASAILIHWSVEMLNIWLRSGYFYTATKINK